MNTASSVVATPPAVQKAELQKQLREKIANIRNRRTGVLRRVASQEMTKKDRQQIMREVRKYGVKAIMDRLGIHDKDVEMLVSDMIRNEKFTDVDHLVKRVEELQRKVNNQRELAKMDEVVPSGEILDVEPLPSLPSANEHIRAKLKPMSVKPVPHPQP